MKTEKEEIKVRFNAIKENFRRGDSRNIAEMSGKSRVQCRQIIQGIRKPQLWFLDVAEDYLRVLGRI